MPSKEQGTGNRQKCLHVPAYPSTEILEQGQGTGLRQDELQKSLEAVNVKRGSTVLLIVRLIVWYLSLYWANI